MDRTGKDRLHAYAILLFTPLFFSSNMVLGRAAVAEVEPWTLTFWRWLIAFLILLPFAWKGLREHRAVLLAEWKSLLLLGFIGMWICGGIVYLSLRETTATNGTLIYTSSPVFILLLEIAFRGQRSSLRQITGIVLAFLGVAAIVLRGDVGRLASLEFNPGDIGIAVAAVAWSVYSVILKRPALGRLPTIPLFAAIALVGWIVVAPFMVWEMSTVGSMPDTPTAWASILGLAVVPSVLAFSTYQLGVKVVGPTVTGIFMYLLPAYGVGLAVVFLDERLAAYHTTGFVLVTAGVVLATFPASLVRRRSGLRAR